MAPLHTMAQYHITTNLDTAGVFRIIMFQDKSKKKITRELISTILARKPKMCSFIEWKDLKIVYKRYASLYFCAAIDVSIT